MSDAGEQPADLAVSAFVQYDLQVGALLLPTSDSYVRYLGEAVRKMNALPELAENGGLRRTRDANAIDLIDAVTGMCQLIGEFAIIRQDDQAFARLIKSPHGEQPFVAANQVDGTRPSTGIVVRTQDPGGLVKHVVNASRSGQRCPIDSNPLCQRIHARPECLHDRAINFDASFEDQLLAVAPTTDAGSRENLLESLDPGRLVFRSIGDVAICRAATC